MTSYIYEKDFLVADTNQKEILLADLKSIKYAEKLKSTSDLTKTVNHFIEYHHHLTKKITGTTVSRLEAVDKNLLGEIIYKWACLYLEAVQQLRQRFPLNTAPHLVIDSKDWSQDLEINAFGLLRIANESRYAEYWAEKSLTDSTMFHSYDERFNFLANNNHFQISNLKLTNSLVVFDQSNLGITTYDLFQAIFQAPNVKFVSGFKSHNWKVVAFDKTARQYCMATRKAAKGHQWFDRITNLFLSCRLATF